MIQKKWKEVLSLFMKSGRRYFHFSLLLFMDEREYWWFWKSERTYFHPTHESLLGFLLNVDHLYLQEVIVHHRQLSGGDVRRGWKHVICQTNKLWVVVVHFFAVAFFADLLKSCSLFFVIVIVGADLKSLCLGKRECKWGVCWQKKREGESYWLRTFL